MPFAAPAKARVASIGARAVELLSLQSSWTCAASFHRSLYLQSGEAFLCVGDPSIGDGPINVILADAADLARCSVAAVGASRPFAWTDEQVWRAPPWPSPRGDALASQRIGEVSQAASIAAPPESLLAAMRAAATPISEHFQNGLAALSRAVAAPTDRSCDAAVLALLGLGHGLTPGGDDALSGALIFLHATSQPERAAGLIKTIRQHMRGRTSPLSCAFLDIACAGEPAAPVYEAVSALMAGAPADTIITPLAGVGHTSGFDMLAGILTAAGSLSG